MEKRDPDRYVHNYQESDCEDTFETDTGTDIEYFPEISSQEGSSGSGEDSKFDSLSILDNNMVVDSDSSSSTVFPKLMLDSSLILNISNASTTTSSLNLTPIPNKTRDFDKQESIVVQDSGVHKTFYCLFCKIPQKKLPRHLTTRHSTEKEVIEYMEEKDHLIKSNILTKIRNLGNHMHNIQVLQKNEGNLIVVHRPRKKDKTSYKRYVPCSFCYGYFLKTDLWKHKCTLQDKSLLHIKGRKKVAHGMLLLPNSDISVSDEMHMFFHTFRTDAVVLVARNDSLIVQLLQKEFRKNGHDSEQHNYIRTKLRETTRLLIKMREISNRPSARLEDFLTPSMYETVTEGVKSLCGFKPVTQEFGIPSLALKLGHNLKKCALLLKASRIQNNCIEDEKETQRFIDLMNIKWTEEVSHHALRTIHKVKRNKPKLLPLTEDVVKMSTYIQETASNCIKVLRTESADENEKRSAWDELNQCLLVQTIMFNRRRQGEVSKMTIADFQSRNSVHDNDVLQSLSVFEQKLCTTLTRIEICGKRGRTVPVLLTKEMNESLETLISHRQNMNVSHDNNFLFPVTNNISVRHLRGDKCLRLFANKSNVKNPDQMKSTALRKHIATISQVINLKDNELDVLADFMGHDIRVHRNFYRLPEATFQAAKIAKLLMGMETGTLTAAQGLTLDTITVNADEVLEEVSEDDSVDTSEDESEEGTIRSDPSSVSQSVQVHLSGVATKAQPLGQLCLSFDHHSERSTSPLSPVRSGFGPPETKIMPLSSFRESDNRKLFANAKYSFNDPGFHPYFGDKPINSSLKRSPFSSQPPNSSFALKNASGTGSHRSLPHNKNGTRQVTFSTNRSLPRYDVGKRAPYSSKYEHLLPETGGYYGSLSKGVDDEDGNGSTTGSYTLEITDLDECMS